MNNPEDKEYIDLPHTHIVQVDNHDTLESLIDMIPSALEKLAEIGRINGYSLENVVDIEIGEEDFYCIVFKTDKNVDMIHTAIDSFSIQYKKKNKDKNQNNDRRK